MHHYLRILRLALYLLAIQLLLGCASLEPIKTRDFSGDIQISKLVIEFEKIDESGVNEGSDNLVSSIKRIQKYVQEISDLLDQRRAVALNRQLVEFQNLFVAGLAKRQNYPFVVTPDRAPKLVFDPDGELSTIEFSYSRLSGASAEVDVQINYYEKTLLDIAAADQVLNARRIKVKPDLMVRLRGTNGNGELFLRDSYRFRSQQSFTIANDFLLGISRDRVQDAKIFLVPVAQELNR